ncbi:MAG TPA: hypothetical protein VHM91_08870 [Verrucomicrobiales bacterium]|jgi:hypothetical protein|nr:hypothetical protein [Verrucomicrobiales bacterium]
MNERRVLTALFLLALAGAGYLWWRRNQPVEGPKSPVKVEAEERAKADPFPQK